MLTPRIACNPDGIPQELRAYAHWVVWKMLPPRKEGAKPVKLPCDPKTGKEASAGDPSTWGTYEQAVARFRRGGYAGLGFEFHTTDPFIGGDIDNCRNPQTGELSQAAQIALALCDTYAEVSPSGTGIKFIGRGQKVGTDCKRGDVEMYDQARFFALTGEVVEAETGIADRHAEFAGLYRLWFPQKEKPVADRAPRPALTSGTQERLSDERLLEIAFRSQTGATIRALYDGALCGKPSESEARSALIWHLWFYAGSEWGDGAAQLERLLWSSQRDKSKWEDARGSVSFLRYECDHAVERYTGGFYNPSAAPLDIVVLMPPEEEPQTELGQELTLEAWKKRGKRLQQWKSACDEEFKWRVADWYNEVVRDLDWGQRSKFVKALFGDVLERQIRIWASAVVKWPKEERRPDRPFWLHQELAGQSAPVRNDIMRRYADGGVTRESVRTEIGEKPVAKPPKWWQVLKADLPEDVGAALARHLEADPQELVNRLKALLRTNSPATTLPTGYFSEFSNEALVEDAKQHLQTLQEAENQDAICNAGVTNSISKTAVFASKTDSPNSDDFLPLLDPEPPQKNAYIDSVIEDNALPSAEQAEDYEALLSDARANRLPLETIRLPSCEITDPNKFALWSWQQVQEGTHHREAALVNLQALQRHFAEPAPPPAPCLSRSRFPAVPPVALTPAAAASGALPPDEFSG